MFICCQYYYFPYLRGFESMENVLCFLKLEWNIECFKKKALAAKFIKH